MWPTGRVIVGIAWRSAQLLRIHGGGKAGLRGVLRWRGSGGGGGAVRRADRSRGARSTLNIDGALSFGTQKTLEARAHDIDWEKVEGRDKYCIEGRGG